MACKIGKSPEAFNEASRMTVDPPELCDLCHSTMRQSSRCYCRETLPPAAVDSSHIASDAAVPASG